MVKRKATPAGARNAKKQTSPLQPIESAQRINKTASNAKSTVTRHDKTLSPPDPDTFITVKDCPDFVEHPEEETMLHNTHVIKRRIDKRHRKKLEELSSEAVVQRLGLPFKIMSAGASKTGNPQHSVKQKPAQHDQQKYRYGGADAAEMAAPAPPLKTNKFEAVQVCIDDYNRVMKYVWEEGVPAANAYYSYKPVNSVVVTTTGKRVPVNSILCVRDVMQVLMELHDMLGRLLGVKESTVSRSAS